MIIKINPEIEIKDIVNSILLIIGGIITFWLIDRVSVNNDTLRTKQILLNELPTLYPEMKIHFTNELSDDKTLLRIKVYMKNKGEYPLFVGYPSLYLMKGNDTIQYYSTPDLTLFGGLISPELEYEINYNVHSYNADSIPNRMAMTYAVNVDQKIINTYGNLLSEAIDQLNDSTIYWITHKQFKYSQEIFDYGENKIWDDFFQNPR